MLKDEVFWVMWTLVLSYEVRCAVHFAERPRVLSKIDVLSTEEGV